MIYAYTLTAVQQAIMDAKVVAMTPKDGKNAPTVQSLIDQKVAEFIDACSRDVHLDVDSKLTAALAKQDAAAKQALLAQLEAV